MTASARPKGRDSTRDMLVDATIQIMIEEGYAAATSRRRAWLAPDRKQIADVHAQAHPIEMQKAENRRDRVLGTPWQR